MKTINIQRLSDTATLPTRAHAADAGLDLYCAEDVSYKASDNVLVVSTKVAVEVPEGFVGLVRDRSSVSKKALKVTAGVVDAGYTGEVNVVFLNLSGKGGHISKGDKIAQILIVPVATPAVVEVKQLDQTARGDKGFGSSGSR